MRFHILTAVTRPENLPAVSKSILQAERPPEITELVWHQRFDPDHQHIGGQHLKNLMLDGIQDGAVYILDDDTVLHPKLMLKTVPLLGEARAVVVSQKRWTGELLKAEPGNLIVGGVDIGQAVLARDLIGDRRIPLDYDGDGHFLRTLLQGRDDVIYLDEVLSAWNTLRTD